MLGTLQDVYLHAMTFRTFALLATLALSGCGSDATPSGTSILVANVEDDLPEAQRGALAGAQAGAPVSIAFPDGEGSVEIVTTAAPTMMRTIEVRVADAGGYEISAELVGQPTNAGTVEAPVHTRIVLVTRRRSSLTGSSMGQMSIRVSPTGAERI